MSVQWVPSVAESHGKAKIVAVHELLLGTWIWMMGRDRVGVPLRDAQHAAVVVKVIQEAHRGVVQRGGDALLEDGAGVLRQRVPRALQGPVQRKQPGLDLVQKPDVDADPVLRMHRLTSKANNAHQCTAPLAVPGTHRQSSMVLSDLWKIQTDGHIRLCLW